ncbi:MAG: T9SS type A sorting domain-containing protein, partial [Bacteroidales bacterium]|nr:T9SS type A sorting domain-containing protein [Bacteroidales bacterium]
GTLSSAFIPEGTINYNAYALEAGHIEVHRTLYYENTDLDYYHHQVAAPVGGVTLGDWNMIDKYSYAYELLPDQSWFNIYEPTRPTNPGYGFILSLYGNSGFATSTQPVIFYDNLVLGSVNPAINPGDSIVSLIGNPYTAPISWDYMIADGTNNMEDVVYVWDPAGGNYVQYVSTEGGAGNQSARYIQPGQAFFVEAKDNAPVFSITPGARTTNIEPYLKSAPQNSLRLYTAGGNSTYDETYIRFVGADVSGGYDSDYDAKEWPSSYGEDATEIYTVGTDGQYMAIDSRPLTPELMSVPLSFKPAVEAEYTLAVDVESMQSFSPGTEIFLEDTHIPGQAWIDLREFPEYTFNAVPQDEYARFIVHFQIKDFGIDELAEKPISIFGERTDAIVKNNSGQRINEIQVYDIAGNLMSVKAGITSEVTRMFVSSNTGYYVIKVITDKAVYSEKVLITK